MLIPQYYRQIAPGVRPVNEAATVAPDAGLGRAVSGLGEAVTGYANKQIARSDALAVSRAWRQLDDWRVKYILDLPGRRKALSQTALDPATGANRTGYEAELETFPDQMREQYQRIGTGLSGDARAEFEARWNYHAPAWAGEAVQSLRGLELEDVTLEIDSFVQQDRTSDALYLAENFKDRFSPAQYQSLQARIAKGAQQAAVSGAESYLQGIGEKQGWPAAAEVLARPEFQQMMGLDLSEASEMRADLEGFVRDGAAMAENRLKNEREQNANTFLAACDKGDADLDAGRKLMEAGKLDRNTYFQGKAIQIRPVTENNPKAYDEMNDAVSDLNAARIDRGRARQMLQNRAGVLTKQARDNFSDQIARAQTVQGKVIADLVQYSKTQLVTAPDEDSLAYGAMAAALQQSTSVEHVRQSQTQEMFKHQLNRILQENPEISGDDLYTQGMQLLVRFRDQGEQEIEETGRAWEEALVNPEKAELKRMFDRATEEDRAKVNEALDALPLSTSQSERYALIRKTLGEASPIRGPELPPPEGLETLWGGMSEEEKATARRMLSRGISAQTIADRLGGGR